MPRKRKGTRKGNKERKESFGDEVPSQHWLGCMGARAHGRMGTWVRKTYIVELDVHAHHGGPPLNEHSDGGATLLSRRNCVADGQVQCIADTLISH